MLVRRIFPILWATNSIYEETREEPERDMIKLFSNFLVELDNRRDVVIRNAWHDMLPEVVEPLVEIQLGPLLPKGEDEKEEQ